MELIIGGYAQGKFDFVRNSIQTKKYVIIDGASSDSLVIKEIVNPDDIIVVNHLHCLIRRRMQVDRDPKQEIMEFICRYPKCILICDEIGNGIVPMDAFEREYRENTGRILIEVAKKADKVVRVSCGIGQVIKSISC